MLPDIVLEADRGKVRQVGSCWLITMGVNRLTSPKDGGARQ